GNFIKARTSSFNGIPSPQDAEAFALQKSLEWIQLLQLSNVIFETDCKMITHHLGSDRNGHSDFNFILAYCKKLLPVINNSRVNLIKRQVNLVTHKLVRASRNHVGSYGYHCMPFHVHSDIFDEM
ncbi:hypothetical protein glysoja_016296, partial [Glycine soja]